jgi:chromosome segregation ATPase
MPKFAPADSYEPETTPLSPNRAALKELNDTRAASKATIAELRERLQRLDALKAAIQPLEAELAALDAAEAAALAEWSATPDAPAPEPDLASRDAIVARLNAARQKVAGADAATASVEHVLNTANDRAAALERSVPVHIARVLIDEAHALLSEIAAAATAFELAMRRYNELKEFLLTRIEASPKDSARQEAHMALEKLNHAADAVKNNPPAIDRSTAGEWRALAQELGDTAILPTPAPIVMFDLPETKWVND